jgi:hypothetical protein
LPGRMKKNPLPWAKSHDQVELTINSTALV